LTSSTASTGGTASPTTPGSCAGSAATLDELALHYGTDKSSAGHGYTAFYEQYLGPLRDGPITLLELGVWEGASLRLWRDYLSHARIIGVDKYDRDIHIDGVEIVIAEQDDRSIARLGSFDVIVDDASHLSSKTIRSFHHLFPRLRPGGLYVIEDLQTSYDTEHYEEGQQTAMQFCQELVHYVNGVPTDELLSVHFLPNICFVTKR